MLVGDQSTFSTPKGSPPKPTGLGASLTGLSGGQRSSPVSNPFANPTAVPPRPGSTAPLTATTTGSVGPVPVLSNGATGVSPYPPGLAGLWGQYAPEQTPNPYLPQMGALSGWFDWQNQYANQSTGLQQQSLGVNLAGNQIDQNANAAEGGIIDKLKGLAGQDYQNILAGFGIDRTEAGQRRDRDQFDEDNRATAGGVSLFPAHGRNTGDIESAYTNTTGRIGLGEKGAGITHQQTLLGLDRQKLQNSTQAQKLDLMAQQYGIDGQQLALGLQNTIAGLGYQEGMQMADLLEQAGSHDQAQAQQALAALGQLVSLAPMFGGFGGS